PATAYQEPRPRVNGSDAGRSILALPAAERARMAGAAYQAWSAHRLGGTQGGGLRRLVSDLLRAKLPLTEADAVAMVQSGARDGFTYASYSPDQAVLGALERYVTTHGVSSELRGALEHLLGEMARQGAANNAQGRKLKSGVEALLAHEEKVEGAANTVPLFKPKQDDWGVAVMAKLATLPAQAQGPLGALLTLASQGGNNAKPAKGWLKSAAQALDRP